MKTEITIKNLTKSGVFLAIFSVLFQGSIASANANDELIHEESVTSDKSTWQSIREKVRMRTFTEFMTPAFDNHGNYIPYENGSKLLPTNLFNIVWVDYEIAKDLKVVYHQRFNTNFADTAKSQGLNNVFRNPRFAIRKLNVFNVPNLITSYDFYVQPGLAPEASGSGRDLEFGIRTATSYTFPGSRWSIGATSETTVSIAFKTSPAGSSSFYGWLMPWGSYNLNKIFSTQHYLDASICHARGSHGLQPDYPMPIAMQNGIGITVTEKIWAAVFVNNYLNTLPTLANTWMSVWLSLNVL